MIKQLSLLLITLQYLTTITNQRLKVLSPDSLADSFTDKKISYVTAHFGNVPYGSEIVGFMHQASNIKGCSEIEQLDPFDKDDDQPILLVERGDCQFFTKALNAQHAGAKMLIIYDHKSDVLNYYPVSYDKRAQEIAIPTIVIGHSDGLKLIELLKDKDLGKSLILEFEVPLPLKDEVTMNLVLSAADTNAYEFLNNFEELYASLGDKFNLEPLFFTHRLWEASRNENDNSCLEGNNNVCLSTVDVPQTYLKQQVYQTCLIENTKTLKEGQAWNKKYYKDCLNSGRGWVGPEKIENCQKNVTNDILGAKMSDLILKCVEEQKKNGYQQLLAAGDKIRKSSIYSHPVLIVNGKAVYGGLNTENAFDAACNAFDEPPESCTYVENKYVYNEKINELIKNHVNNESQFLFVNVGLILIVFVVAGLCFYVIFKKLYTNIIRTQIDSMVKDSIQSYKAMSDQDNEL